MSIRDKIESFLERHGIEPKKASTRSYIFDCPSCGGKDKLYIQREDGRSVCWTQKTDQCPKIGSRGAYALSIISGLSIQQVASEIFSEMTVVEDDFLAQIQREITAPPNAQSKQTLDPIAGDRLPPLTFPIDANESAEGLSYLMRRGVTLDMAKKYGIAYASTMRRVLFPVIMGDAMYGWQARAIDPVDKQFRMYNLPGEWKARSLMFFNNILDKDYAILAEGPVSALKFEQVGHFVASMGKLISDAQLQLIRDAGVRRLYLALDRDAVNLLDDIRIRVGKIAPSMECYYIDTPAHRDDFGDCTLEECASAFESAIKLDGSQVFVHFD